MSKKIEFEKSSGNVFKDLDLPDADALFLKATLGFEVFQIIEDRQLTQAEAAKILGVKQPEISRLKKGKFNHYSVERLLTFLNRLNRDIEIRITPSGYREGQQRVTHGLVRACQRYHTVCLKCPRLFRPKFRSEQQRIHASHPICNACNPKTFLLDKTVQEWTLKILLSEAHRWCDASRSKIYNDAHEGLISSEKDPHRGNKKTIDTAELERAYGSIRNPDDNPSETEKDARGQHIETEKLIKSYENRIQDLQKQLELANDREGNANCGEIQAPRFNRSASETQRDSHVATAGDKTQLVAPAYRCAIVLPNRKNDLPSVLQSAILFKPVVGGTATNGASRFCHPPTVAGG